VEGHSNNTRHSCGSTNDNFYFNNLLETVTNLKDPDGLFMPLSSASEDLTDHWMSTLAKQLRQRRRVMASKM